MTLAISIRIFIKKWVKNPTIFPISKEIIPKKTFAYPNKIITPDIGTASKLDIKNNVDMLLKFITSIGKTIICAANVIATISAIFTFIYFDKNFLIGKFRYIIPRVPKYDNCTPKSLIENGLSSNIIKNDNEIDVNKSSFL